MLYTLMLPDDGRIVVDNIDAVADPQGARFALGVLPDQSGLYPRLTAREHIEYFGELQGITGADLRSRTDHLLKMLDMSGSFWPNIFAKFQPCSLGHTFAGGASFGSPFGAPASTHFTMVSISLSESERSFSNSVMPTVLSMCQGGICRVETRLRIDLAHGRDSSNETSDIGAIESGRWQASHLFWKIGAISFVKVGDCAAAAAGSARRLSTPNEVAIRLISRSPSRNPRPETIGANCSGRQPDTQMAAESRILWKLWPTT